MNYTPNVIEECSEVWSLSQSSASLHKPNMMRNIVAGNWKSNKLLHEAVELMNEVKAGLSDTLITEVIIAPPAPYLSAMAGQAGETLQVASQQ